jgi:hypothetical protein
MRQFIKSAVIIIALAGVPVVANTPAFAAVDFSISLGNGAFGFSDGYWDRDHHWHVWRNTAERKYFRDHYGEHYADTRHDRDRNDRTQGWRENNRWWEQGRDEKREQDRH